MGTGTSTVAGGTSTATGATSTAASGTSASPVGFWVTDAPQPASERSRQMDGRMEMAVWARR